MPEKFYTFKRAVAAASLITALCSGPCAYLSSDTKAETIYNTAAEQIETESGSASKLENFLNS